MQTKTYEAQSARDAQQVGYGDRSYWDYLEDAAHRNRDYFQRHPELGVNPDTMITRTLSESLMGNNGP